MAQHGTTIISKEIDFMLKAALAGKPAHWPETAAGQDVSRFLEASLEHGIQPLLYHSLGATECLSGWPESVKTALQRESAAQIILNSLIETDLRGVLMSLTNAGIHSLLIKGAPLSYTHYAFPYLRPRSDTDLLIEESCLHKLQPVMAELGYTAPNKVSGDFVSHQITYVKELRAGVRCYLDFHWKLTNTQLFADSFSFPELAGRSITIPTLGSEVRALGPVHALLLACLHRVAHHYDSDRLIWLYDIHLLANGMDRREFEEFARLAAESRIRTICLRGLRLAQLWLGTRLPDDLMNLWSKSATAQGGEPSEQFFKQDLRRLDLLILDLKQLRGWSKIQLLGEHLFPSADYMLKRYKSSSRLLLPLFYLRRIMSGAWKMLRPLSK
jgi:Uncharacterised nucleotidyltransferase